MNDITYCVSKNCDKQCWCQRHISNNDLKGKIYSASDLTPIGDNCEFIIENIENEQHENKTYLCEYCSEELHGEPQVGHLGLKYIHCDHCGEDSYNEEFGEIKLNKDNLNFPQHYYNFNNGKDITDEEINDKVRKCLEYLENNPTEDFVEYGTGNTNICVTRYDGDDEYRVVVSKGYYDTYIPIKI